MFSDKKNKPSNNIAKSGTSERNIISSNTTFIGDIISKGDFRIDGTVEGTIKTSARVIVGKEGVIKGDIICNNADIEGTINGSLSVEQLLTLKKSAKVQGEVSMDKLSVEPGAVFNVNCSMKGAVKALNHNDKKRTEQTQTA
jgi:cytoskeletal protein CcmA (bactofilin family)